MKDIMINAMGEQCPVPVIKTMKALDSLTEPAVVEVHVDNRTAVENLTRLADSRSLPKELTEVDEGHFVMRFTAEAPDGSGQAAPATEMVMCTPQAAQGPLVAVIGSDTMGSGDDELGRTLMKGFIFALSQLDHCPDILIFYNGGARLTVEGSVSVEDLKIMEDQGSRIITCGTCLNFYGLTDKLAVGSISNMYDIVEAMNGAGKIIRP